MGEGPGYSLVEGLGGCPAGPPQVGYDSTDASVGKMHRMLEQYVKGSAVALQSNLRCSASSTPPSPYAVWNHAVWRYDAVYSFVPMCSDRVVEVSIIIKANKDEYPSDGIEDRVVTYVYVVEYKDDGSVDETSTANDWRSVGGDAAYALSTLVRVAAGSWTAGGNPEVKLSNVQALDTSN